MVVKNSWTKWIFVSPAVGEVFGGLPSFVLSDPQAVKSLSNSIESGIQSMKLDKDGAKTFKGPINKMVFAKQICSVFLCSATKVEASAAAGELAVVPAEANTNLGSGVTVSLDYNALPSEEELESLLASEEIDFLRELDIAKQHPKVKEYISTVTDVDEDWEFGDAEGDPAADLMDFLNWMVKSGNAKLAASNQDKGRTCLVSLLILKSDFVRCAKCKHRDGWS